MRNCPKTVEVTHTTDDDARVLDWLKRTASVLDTAVLVASLRADLVAIGPRAAAAGFELVAAGADVGLHDHERLLLWLAVAMEDDALAPLKREAAVLAELDGLFVARDLLAREGVAKEDDGRRPVPVSQMLGRPVTLGERKSLARGRERAVLDRVLRDPSPDVIRLVLGNPAIRESDVVRLVARRPIAPEVLREVFLSLRFIARVDVRVALVKNPSTPTDVATATLRTVPRAQLAEVSTLAELPLVVRDTARRLATRAQVH